jgi:hypothetical protein
MAPTPLKSVRSYVKFEPFGLPLISNNRGTAPQFVFWEDDKVHFNFLKGQA